MSTPVSVPVSPLAQILLYFAAGTSAVCVLGHTKMGNDLVYPSLKKCGPNDNGAKAAKIGWMEVNSPFVLMTILSIKWANVGVTDVYDKALMGAYCAGQFYFGYLYLKAKMYEPLMALWGIPAIMGLSQLV